MNKPALVAKLSRRAIIARSALVAALATLRLSLAARSGEERALGGPAFYGQDGALRQQVALAELFWSAYVRAEADYDRLYEAQRRHEDCPQAAFDSPEAGAAWDGLAERLGIPALEARCQRLFALSEATTRAAFDLPALSLEGTLAKLRLALTTLRAEHRGQLDPPDCAYLDATLADLERLASR